MKNTVIADKTYKSFFFWNFLQKLINSIEREVIFQLIGQGSLCQTIWKVQGSHTDTDKSISDKQQKQVFSTFNWTLSYKIN